MEEGRSALKIIMCKPREKRSVGRSRRRWEDNNIKMDINEVRVSARDWFFFLNSG